MRTADVAERIADVAERTADVAERIADVAVRIADVAVRIADCGGAVLPGDGCPINHAEGVAGDRAVRAGGAHGVLVEVDHCCMCSLGGLVVYAGRIGREPIGAIRYSCVRRGGAPVSGN